MLDRVNKPLNMLPVAPGVGFKAAHFAAILEDPGPVAWLEVHAENYMGDGGRPIAQLRKLSEHFPLSIHGVGLSIGAEAGLDVEHLARLKKLVEWAQPASFSEHLAWSTHGDHYLNDLLPLPYNNDTLNRVTSHILQVQETLGCRMLLENPSNYLAFTETTMEEVEFLSQIAQRTGCGILLDVNNVFISATNQNTDPLSYVNAFPLSHVGEIHLAGHDHNEDESGGPLLIDSHGREVADPVWALYRHTIERGGPKPTLIEWDNNVPDWPILAAEAMRVVPLLSITQS